MRIILVLATCAIPATACAGLIDWWLTPDQQGQRLEKASQFDEAAQRYRDPIRRGAALYRGGEFEAAAASFGQDTSAEGAYNRGTALVMRGFYEDAIASFDQALTLRPGWREAEENRVLAEARLAAMAPPEDDAGGTGGKLGADEVVFDLKKNQKGTETQEEGGKGKKMSDQEVRAMWLRRLQTSPADFMRNKFSYQFAMQQDENAAGEAGTQ